MGRGTGQRRGPWGRAEELTAALVDMVERKKKKFASGEVLGFDGWKGDGVENHEWSSALNGRHPLHLQH